jgi:hypothetical protein
MLSFYWKENAKCLRKMWKTIRKFMKNLIHRYIRLIKEAMFFALIPGKFQYFCELII